MRLAKPLPHDLYEIPISPQIRATRIPMPRVARIRRCSPSISGEPKGSEHQMYDIILLAGGLALFALSIAYAFACDRL